MAICSPESSSPEHGGKTAWIVLGLLAGAAVADAGAYGLYWLRRGRFRSRVIGVIPARYASSRFQGKPLVPILGKPMIQRTWERAKLATTLDQVGSGSISQKIIEAADYYMLRYWLSVAAQPSNPVKRLLFRAGILPLPPMLAMKQKGGPRDTHPVNNMTGLFITAKDEQPLSQSEVVAGEETGKGEPNS